MRESFEEQKKRLVEHYGTFSMEDRRQILCKLRKRNILMYRQLGRLKHELLRLESKRVQCELDGRVTQAEVVENKILKKKEQYLKVLAQNKK
ncbi:MULTISPECIES: hypothetical protein [Enterococcus]|uniref:Uncharacterized protein n=1 Tax=Enterococcus mundtii TaxID=53346 RepID=A0A1L8V218_ENTMU|nr:MULTISPECIES: hypothetical protein [Enterococcus]GEN17763.1 hypothetical protein LAC02_10440 [Ligilactobacillus acidipiscis]AUB52362.1 hypothetical protein EM4838_04990 [Enterococcus mundtii]MDA9461773.1 hypothetical protein [Enterococcus mundtii 3F]MDB7086544.1 hypothetical protein [Enterococcus mundtii]MZZ58086.1 hypothetical protein [Enterococcus mundtii]